MRVVPRSRVLQDGIFTLTVLTLVEQSGSPVNVRPHHFENYNPHLHKQRFVRLRPNCYQEAQNGGVIYKSALIS